jgi:hypothetical protein
MVIRVKSQPITRDKLVKALGSHELVKAFENLQSDVGETLPGATDQASADAAAAMSAAQDAQTAADAAQAAATAAQGDATALKALPYVTLAASPTTANERVLAVDPTLTLTDGGAGNAVTLGLAAPEAFIAPTLLGAWANYGSPFNPPGYYKDKAGIVHLRGLVMSGAVPSAIFTLPAGYRPANQELFAVAANNAFGRVDVLPSGDVQFSLGSSAYVSLDGITFRAA